MHRFAVFRTKLLRLLKTDLKRAHLWVLVVWMRRHGLLLFGSGVLLLSTLLWSYWSASLNMQNSDALVNSLLFKDSKTLEQAEFPGQHSLLLKWPLFWLFRLVGYSNTSFIWVTVLVVLLTVVFLMWLLRRIEKRNSIVALWYLALAAILAMVPAQPYPGALLPVNMAMLTTRNLEYVVFVVSLILLARQPLRLRSWRWVLSVLLLGLLIASDKLFLGIGLAGAFGGLIVFALRNRWRSTALSAQWFVVMVLGAIMATGMIAALNVSHLTTIANRDVASPYVLNHSLKNLALGTIYAVAGIATNFSANPAFDATQLKTIPASMRDHLLGVGSPAYIVNALVLLVLLYATLRIAFAGLGWFKRRVPVGTGPANLAVMLSLSSLAATGLFIVSDHYFAVDARYLSLWVFTLIISGAVYFSRRKFSHFAVMIIAVLLTLSTVFGIVAARQNNRLSSQALDPIVSRNKLVSHALQSHAVDTLVGDYWRVVPIAQQTGSAIAITPLQSCTQTRRALSSKSWQPDLAKHSFAYILSLDKSLTDYPACSFADVVKAYGLPNANVLIAGSFEKPKELLMFYDHGAQPQRQARGVADFRSIQPVSLNNLLNTGCENPTIVSVVAHQDDDLLFMNPDLQHAIDSGFCVRTVYLTAGDSGYSKQYWLSREQGSEAAYASMLGKQTAWSERVVKLANGEYATVASPVGNNKISLIFMRLPDGNLQGEGFAASSHESLNRLETGAHQVIHSVDKQSVYSYDQLTIALSELIRAYEPSEIRTQSNNTDETYPDHSDHRAVGRLVARAYDRYASQIGGDPLGTPVTYYLGYPVHSKQDNVSGDDLKTKEKAFFEYARYDGGVCRSMRQCNKNYTYGIYLRRQYTSPN